MHIGARNGCRSALLYAMLAAFSAKPSPAAQWSIEPSVDLRTEYNDNFDLAPAATIRVWGVTASPAVTFGWSTETVHVTGALRFNLNRYFGEEGLDTDDHIATLRSGYSGERDSVELNIESLRDSTLASELIETGVVLRRQQRTRLAVNPSWRRSLTETTTLSASYRYADVHYASAETTGATDYRDHNVVVALQSRLGERDTATFDAYYARYETAQSRANSYGIDVAYERAFSETLRGNLLAGIRSTRSSVFAEALVCDGEIVFGFCIGNVVVVTSTASDNSIDYVFAAALERRWETASLSGRISHQINPSGVGALVETDRVELTWSQQWSATVTSSLAAAAYETRNIGSHVTGTKSRYYSLEPRVSWRMTEWWTLSAGYSYRHTSYADTSAQASANVGYVVVSYAWPRISVSR